jgi:enoyl-CoA hydratase
MEMLQPERRGRVLVVRIDNPPHNFMNRDMVEEFDRMTLALRSDRDVGAVVLTGAPERLFVTHYDVAEILAGVEAVGVTPGPRGAGALLRLAGGIRRVPGLRGAAARSQLAGLLELRQLHDALLRLGRLDQVVIAAINGPAIGGGCELALACDLRFMADDGIPIGLPEMTMGFNPGAGGTQRMARLLGPGAALEAMLEGRTFTASEAAEAGLINRAVGRDTLMDEVMACAKRMSRRSPGSVRALKAAVYEGASRNLKRGLAEERRRFMSVGGLPGARRAMSAFVRQVADRGGSPWVDREALRPWQEGTAADMVDATEEGDGRR